MSKEFSDKYGQGEGMKDAAIRFMEEHGDQEKISNNNRKVGDKTSKEERKESDEYRKKIKNFSEDEKRRYDRLLQHNAMVTPRDAYEIIMDYHSRKESDKHNDYLKDSESAKKEEEKEQAGKESPKEESKPQHTQAEIDADVKKYTELAQSISMPSSFLHSILGGYGDKSMKVTKDSPIVKYVADKYGTTEGGKKRDIHNALEAFHKDAKQSGIDSIKVSPQDQSKIDGYEKRIASADKERKLNTAINKAVRDKDVAKGDAKLKEMGMSEGAIKSLRNPSYGRPGIPAYQNQNLGGRIKNYRDQIEKIKKSSKTNQEGGSTKEGDTGVHGISFENNQDDERVRLTFDDKPNADARQTLKRGGFKWSPRNQAWQRQNNSNGHSAVKRVLEDLKGKDDIYKSIDNDLEKAEDVKDVKSSIDDIFDSIGA